MKNQHESVIEVIGGSDDGWMVTKKSATTGCFVTDSVQVTRH